jgi:hypothetical protein
MHGLERRRNLKEGTEPPDYTRVRRIRAHYSDGRTISFRPEDGREFFNQDDAEQLVKVLEEASSKAEWAEASDRHVE